MLPIDVIYTWVNSLDASWQIMHALARKNRVVPDGEHQSADDAARYMNRNEIVYSVRSIKKYAPWVRNIYVLTNCSLPKELKSVPGVYEIKHEMVFEQEQLPTFNAFAIETTLHLIPELSERFLYFNDDFFLCQPMVPEDFFWGARGVYFFPSQHDIPYKRGNLRPVDQGAINSSKLLEQNFGFLPPKKLHHAPYPLSKSILFEIQKRYASKVKETRGHAFRHPDDIAMATTLHAYFAKCIGLGKEKNINSRYVDIGDWRFLGLIHPLSPLARGKYKTLCLNEVTSIKLFPRLRNWIVIRLMKSLFDR